MLRYTSTLLRKLRTQEFRRRLDPPLAQASCTQPTASRILSGPQKPLRSSAQASGASYPRCPFVQHIVVDQGSVHTAVAEQYLNRADVDTLFQQVRGE
jgi:hypothetical protein